MSERADPHKIWELAEIPGKRFDRNAASPLSRYIDTSLLPKVQALMQM